MQKQGEKAMKNINIQKEERKRSLFVDTVITFTEPM